MRLLIADDDEANLLLLGTLLEDLGHEVIVAHNGEEAWRLLHADEAPTLAILDWIMPGLYGTEICRRLREQGRRPYQYVIVLTAKEQMDDLVEAIASGADDFLRKPFDARELRARLAAGERVLALQEELRARAMLDELTGLLNRATILERLHREIGHAMRNGDAVSIVLIDLDNFKCINDNHGHAVGDEVLRLAAKRLNSSVRASDELGRYGGEEFLAVLSSSNDLCAVEVAERMRESLLPPAETSAGMVCLSASFGIATADRDRYGTPDRLVAEADAALYRAKRAGKNRVAAAVPYRCL